MRLAEVYVAREKNIEEACNVALAVVDVGRFERQWMMEGERCEKVIGG